jgi:hypothetical protein
MVQLGAAANEFLTQNKCKCGLIAEAKTCFDWCTPPAISCIPTGRK